MSFFVVVRKAARIAPLLACAGVFVACSDTPVDPSVATAPAAAFNGVTVAPQAALMAVGDSLQLDVTRFALDSTVLADADSIAYSTSDVSRVEVTSLGVVHAKAVTNLGPVKVIATVRRQGITRADTAYVGVVATRGTVPTFSIADPGAAGAKSPGTYVGIATSLTYMAGGTPTTLTGNAVPVNISITPASIAAPYDNRTFVATGNSGRVFVTATLTAFGTPLTDTISYTLTDAASFYVSFMSAGATFFQGNGVAGRYSVSGTTLHLRAGGYITFSNSIYSNPPSVGVTFRLVSGEGPAPDSTAALATAYASARVTFPNPGTYVYSWNRAADTLITDPDKRGGTIVVR
jgi:hypothetical protein